MARKANVMFGVAIDLGTSNSAVCRVQLDQGKPAFDFACDLSGEREIVSAIYVDSNGYLYYGRGASRRQADGNEEERVLGNLKLLLRDNRSILIGGVSYKPVELVRNYLAFLKSCYEQRLSNGLPLRKAVITVPAGSSFDIDYRSGLEEAIEGLGREPLFDEWEILEEPDAALLSLVDLKPLDGQRVLIFDMGGGTLDVCIRKVEARSGQPKLLSCGTEGSTAAGSQLTNALTDLAIDRWTANSGREFSQEERADIQRRNFWRSDESKRLLSAAAIEDGDAWSRRPFDLHLTYAGSSHTVEFAAADLSLLSQPIAERAQHTVMGALEDAGLTPKDIDSYFMVGGSSQLTVVQHMMTELLGGKPNPSIGSYGKMDINVAVVRGAALFALQGYTNRGLAPRTQQAAAIVLPALERRLGYPLSLVVMSHGAEVAVPLLPKGTPLPSQAVDQTVYMPHDASHLDLRLMRGQGDPRLCTPLAHRRLTFDEPREQGLPITVSVSVTGDGRFSLTTDDEGILVAAKTLPGAAA